MSQLYRLLAEGFDMTDTIRGVPTRYRPKCSQCDVLVINGVACHETGCSNQTFECRGCNNRVRRPGTYCGECT